MSYMKQLAEMLGVKVGEEFRVDKGYDTWINYSHNVVFTEDDRFEVVGNPYFPSDDLLLDVLHGRLEVFKLSEPLLTVEERKYLLMVTKLYDEDTEYVVKLPSAITNKEFLFISVKGTGNITLPLFDKGTMYKGLELEKKYELEELSL